MFLQSMNTNMLSSHGTVIDLAIDMSLSFFDMDDKTNKVLIESIFHIMSILTDNEIDIKHLKTFDWYEVKPGVHKVKGLIKTIYYY